MIKKQIKMENIKKFFKGKKVLVTGHTGFKGSWLSRILLLWGADVTGISLKPTSTPSLFNLLKIEPLIHNYFVDIRNFKKIKAIFKRQKPEIVFHLAAQPIVRDSYDDPLYTFETNIIGTANVLEAIRIAKSVKSAVMITTDKVYEEDINTARPYREGDRLGGHDPYSSSKASAELVIASYIKSFFNPENYGKNYNTLIASARAGNIIGGGDWAKDRIIPDLVRSVFKYKQPLIIRSPKAVRPWQYVLQPLCGYLMLAQRLYSGEKKFSGPWNFGPDRKNHIKVEELLDKAFKHLREGSCTIQADHAKHEAAFLSLNSTKARKALGWDGSFSAEDSIKWTLDWYKKYYTGGDIIGFTRKQIDDFFE